MKWRALTFATSAAKVHPEQDVHASAYINVMGLLSRMDFLVSDV